MSSSNPLDRLLESLVGIIDTQLQLLKLEAKEGAAQALSSLVVGLVLLLLLAFVLLMFSVGAALGLGLLLGHYAWGFATVGAVYLLVLSTVWSKRALLKAKVQVGIQQQLHKPSAEALPADDTTSYPKS